MTQRNIFIKYLFDDILRDDYVLLKLSEQSLDTLNEHTDLDILIYKRDLESILKLIYQDASIFKIKKEQKASMVQLFIFFKDSSFLQIDFLFGFYRKTLEYLSQQEVMEYACRNRDQIRICANHHLLEHVFLFQILNGANIPKKYIDYFKNLAPEEYFRLLDYLNDKYDLKEKSVEQLGTYSFRKREKVRSILNKKGINRGWNRLRNTSKYLKDILSSIRNRRGFTITFSGVDGAGKSTIIQEIKTILEHKFRKNVVVLRHRPSILPILSTYKHGKQKAEQIAADTLPRQGKNQSTFSSLVRFTYYYFDYLIGQFYIKVKYHWRGYAVLYDRYYFDFIIDSRRSNIDLPKGLTRFFYKFIYHPPLNLFLYADPKIILQRKKELPSESIVELTENYRALFDNLDDENKRYIALENIDKERTLKTIINHYVEMI